MMHQPNLDKPSGTHVPSVSICTRYSAFQWTFRGRKEAGGVFILAAVELSRYFELLMLSAGH